MEFGGCFFFHLFLEEECKCTCEIKYDRVLFYNQRREEISSEIKSRWCSFEKKKKGHLQSGPWCSILQVCLKPRSAFLESYVAAVCVILPSLGWLILVLQSRLSIKSYILFSHPFAFFPCEIKGLGNYRKCRNFFVLWNNMISNVFNFFFIYFKNNFFI